ncbi:ABC transporter substrate-binding protein [Myroides sp. LJL115]
MYRSIVLCLCIVVTMISYSCKDKAKESPLEMKNQYSVIDASGQRVTLDTVAMRVVVLFDSVVDHVYMLGAQDKLVGIPSTVYQYTDKFMFLSSIDTRIKNKTIATPTFNGRSSDMEMILALEPDLVVCFKDDIQSIEQLETLGVPIYRVSSQNKEDILDQIIGLGVLLGKQQRAKEVTNYVEASLKNMQEYSSDVKKKVYYAWSNNRVLSTSGKGTLIDMVIELAGATNACPLELEAPNIGAESLYLWNPDLIVVWNTLPSDVYAMKELASLPCVENKQVYSLEPSFTYDPHTVKFLLFAKQLKQWCYQVWQQDDFDKQIKEDMDFFYLK